MYDYCSSQVDFHNLHHLACTEVRAANLIDCTFHLKSTLSFLESHQDCVKERAIKSVRIIAGVTKPVAQQAVDKVFNRCYEDLLPVRRRCFNKPDEELAYKEFLHFSKSKLS
eukprot:TRINITY_DN5517_c0_g1_i1.p1 TRINITY_DN5517_c0_g1~~TRINITY_DN5517_c0_g1_i1.p1  ORF type:complete len:112 (-),score=8.85 TRINITY_DN5517_c0_g1_i1:57-392(-)